ncbi:MAG: hypothetical protein U0Y68_08305 [Blastocatellia bacterium]
MHSSTTEIRGEEAAYFERRAQLRNPALSPTIFAFIRSLLLLEEPDGLTAEQRLERRNFVLRFQQLTSPVTAKGVEDTAFYRYYPLASLCEVGGHPAQFGTTLANFHKANQQRLQDWPHSLLATSTHDTKRSEDVRARLNVLAVRKFPRNGIAPYAAKAQSGIQNRRGEQPAPDDREYLLYQTLVGALPFAVSEGARQNFLQRMQEYASKPCARRNGIPAG